MRRTSRVVSALFFGASAITVATVTPTGSQPAAAACSKAPEWHSTSTKFGISLSGSPQSSVIDDLRSEERRFGVKIPVVRTWDSKIPTTNVWAQRAPGFGKRMVVTSIRAKPQQVIAGTYDAGLRNYFRNAPTTTPIFWNYWHEPEDDVKSGQFTAAQYVAAFRHVANIAASYCKSNLYPTLVLMGWTVDSASKLDWTDYYPGSNYVSVLAWDPYNGAHGEATSYRSPATLFHNVVATSKTAGKPWGLAETGTVRIPGDSAGTGRAAWLKSVASYTKSNKAVFVTYFQSTANGDFELRDKASVNAWASAMGS